MFYLSPEGGRYYVGKPFTYNNVMYGGASATQAKYTELGFTRVLVEARPDTRFYIVTGPDDAGQFQSTPRDLEELKKHYIAQAIEECQSALLDTDWMLVRAGEVSREMAVPQAVTTHRADVRAVCKTNVEAIAACKTVEELKEQVDNPATTGEFDLEQFVTLDLL